MDVQSLDFSLVNLSPSYERETMIASTETDWGVRLREAVPRKYFQGKEKRLVSDNKGPVEELFSKNLIPRDKGLVHLKKELESLILSDDPPEAYKTYLVLLAIRNINYD